MKAKHYIFVRGVGEGFVVARMFFFFQSSGHLAFVNMYNFLQVMVLLKKMQFVQMGSVGMNKKFLF